MWCQNSLLSPSPLSLSLSLCRWNLCPFFSFPFFLILMAEASALCFSSFFSVSRSREINFFLSSSTSPFSFPSPSTFSILHPRSARCIRLTSKASDSGNFPGDDSLGAFPWSDGDNTIEWFQEEKLTLFTADGLIQIGGFVVPRIVSSSDV